MLSRMTMGSRVTNAAPRTEPSTEPSPPTMIMAR